MNIITVANLFIGRMLWFPIILLLLFSGCNDHPGKGNAHDLNPMQHTFTYASKVLGEERELLVALPASYSGTDSSQKYPVLVLLDGDSHFEITTKIIDSLSSGSAPRVPEMIVIAIKNVDRERDFTFAKIRTKRPNTMGGGRLFLEFIERELMPYVDEHYRTKPNRILAGHSLGGLLTLNAFIKGEGVFDAYISMDPSIWWDDTMMRDKVAAIAPEAFTKKLYIASANQGQAKYTRNTLRHENLYFLMKESTDLNSHVRMEYFEEEDHRSVPGIAMHNALIFLMSSDK